MPAIAAISIYADDLDAATSFYTKQLGFKVSARPAPVIVELEHEGASLVLCQAEVRTEQKYPASTGTVIGLAWRDVDAAARTLKADGVEVLFPEPQEFPGGRFIALRDPAGNVIELLEFSR
jgi:lactoylglutathione lyase